MLRKFFSCLTVVVMSLGLATPISHASKADSQTNSSVDWKSVTESTFVDMDNISIDKKQMQIADELSNYFEEDVKGDIIFTADKETLIEMGISENDAELMISAGEEFTQIQEENQLEGFVGIRIILGPKVRKMNGWAAGTFAGGYVGWYAKKFAVNPVTAGVAALITGTTVFVVKNAVEHGLRSVSIGQNIPLITMSFNVHVP